MTALLLSAGIGSNIAPTAAWFETLRVAGGTCGEDPESVQEGDLARLRAGCRRAAARPTRAAATPQAFLAAEPDWQLRPTFPCHSERLHLRFDCRNGTGHPLVC